MIDLSCHILHGTPCGPESLAQSLDICRSAIEDGVKTIVATPRWEAGSDNPPMPFVECRHALGQLQHEIGNSLSFELGFVMQYSPALPQLIDKYGASLALGGRRHLLLSLPTFGLPADIERVLWSILDRGFSVLITRPECNPGLRHQPEWLHKLITVGAEIQVDAASVTGDYGRDIQRFALLCLEKYRGRSVLASNYRAAISRRSSLSRARLEVEKIFSTRYARTLVQGRPNEFLSGVPVSTEPPSKPRGNRLFFYQFSLAKKKN